MKDLGRIRYFLGIEVRQSDVGTLVDATKFKDVTKHFWSSQDCIRGCIMGFKKEISC